MRGLRLTVLCCSLMACSTEELPGQYFDVEVSMASDGCNSPAVGYSESFSYRLVKDLESIELGVDADIFASGSISGCSVAYESVAWTETREAGDIRWQILGEAQVQPGDGSCGNPRDWIGTETFTVLSSDDPLVRPGCTYVVDVAGDFVEEVQ